MGLKTYQNVQRAVEDPRATEYRLFGQVTGALIDAKTAGAGCGRIGAAARVPNRHDAALTFLRVRFSLARACFDGG